MKKSDIEKELKKRFRAEAESLNMPDESQIKAIPEYNKKRSKITVLASVSVAVALIISLSVVITAFYNGNSGDNSSQPETESRPAIYHSSLDSESEESVPPFQTDNSYVIVPDDYPVITETVDLSADFLPINKGIDGVNITDKATRNGISDFALSMFRESYKDGENNIFSPSSALIALGMVTNGAYGETKTELEGVLCGTDIEKLNEAIYIYRGLFGKGEKYNTSISNAMWFDERVTVDKNFLQTNADYYGADAYKTKLQSPMALESINGWINEKTNGIIEKMLDVIEDDTAAVIVNTVYFDASWTDKLVPAREKLEFKQENGEKKNVEMLIGSAQSYIENESCIGFRKEYCGNYSFVALLPNEGITVEEYISGLSGEEFDELLNNEIPSGYSTGTVAVAIPKFEYKSEYDLVPSLKSLGVKRAFEPYAADFSNMGTSSGGNLYMSSVLQKAGISLDENGTVAAAATVIQMEDEAEQDEYKRIVLDRPFVYAIIDNTTNLPLFIGTVESF